MIMENLQMWAIGVGVSVAVAAFIRFFPKKKLINWISPIAEGAGKALSKIMILRLGRAAAENVEEGIIATLAATVYAGVDSFMKGLLSDNKKKS
jgi:hypothetical protein